MTRARLLTCALAGLAALASTSACTRSTSAGPVSGVLITLDTTNVDALGAFGGRPGVTPHLDAFAQASRRFTQARTVAPLTLPAHVSMLTGLYPLRHTVRDNGYRPLPASAVTLAERAREAGYETAAILASVVLAAPYGLDQGFVVYDTPAGAQATATAHMVERPAREVTERALAWLAGRDRSRPYFLWVHYFDPHAPYEPPPRFLEQAGGNAYLGEVAAMDAAVGELLAALEDEHAVVVVIADHGEALGRHGEPTHSVLCYDEVLRVPLLVRRPDGAGAGEVLDAPASVVDVFPTFLDAFGLAAPSSIDGVSLLGPGPPADRGLYFESLTGFLNYGWCPLTGWVEGEAKYVHGTNPELYDLARDPAETRNLYPDPRVGAARDGLAQVAGLPALEAAEGELDPALRDEVRALGYAGAADPAQEVPHPLADTGLPDPRERMGELERFYEAVLLRNQGRLEEAIERMAALLQENPLNVYAAGVLASFYLENGQHQPVIDLLMALPPDRRERLNVQDYLGHAFEGLGDRERALRHFRRALELKPGDPHQAADVARLGG